MGELSVGKLSGHAKVLFNPDSAARKVIFWLHTESAANAEYIYIQNLTSAANTFYFSAHSNHLDQNWPIN